MRISDWSSDVCSSDLDASAHRIDEPYRRAFIHLYARLAATSVALTGRQLAQRPTYDAPAYAEPQEFQHELQVIADSLDKQIGRASCRERGCQYVSLSVVTGSLKT